MKNTLYTLVLASGMLIAGIAQVQADVIVAASADMDQDAALVTVDTSTDTSQDGAAGVTADPSADQDQDGSAGIVSNPSGDEDQDGAAGVVSSPSTDEDQDGHVPTTPGNTDNGGSNNGGSTGGSGSSRNSRGSVNPMVLGAATTSCPLITDYLKIGGSNDALQVTKLQIFLNGSEKAGLTVNGIFDAKTEDAVKSFQKKYMADILGPWDATRATGFVFITTMKKINALACAAPITLSAEERAIIEAYKARGGSEQSGVDAEIGSTNPATGTDVAESEQNVGNDNVAATAKASILSRFWNFLKDLFR